MLTDMLMANTLILYTNSVLRVQKKNNDLEIDSLNIVLFRYEFYGCFT